jgi:hypothetical protein
LHCALFDNPNLRVVFPKMRGARGHIAFSLLAV